MKINSLKTNTIFGVIWTFIDSFLLKGIIIISSLLIARVIGPEEYGIYGMIVIFIVIGTSISDSGLSSSLIRSKKIDNEDLSTVFFTNILISLFVYGVFYLASSSVADFFNDNTLILLVKVCCLIFVISSFSAVQMALLTREMQFKRIFQCNFIGSVVGALVGIYLAYDGMGVWSLVFMYLSTQFVLSSTLWVQSSWKPTLTFSKKKFKKHYNFGYKIMLAGLLDKGFQNIYNIVIGKYFSSIFVGYFERAKSLSLFPSSTVSTVIGKVTYPMLSKIQDDKKKMSEIYTILIKVTFFITTPLMLSLASVGTPLFDFILGEQWIPAVNFFQILCLGTLFYPVNALNINVLKVYGRSDLFLKLEIIKKIVITISILITIRYGIIALVWSRVITSVISLFINTYYSGNMIGFNIKEQMNYIIPLLSLSLGIFYLMYLFGLQIESYNLIFRILIPLFSGLIIYLFINLYLKNEALLFLVNMIKKQFKY